MADNLSDFLAGVPTFQQSIDNATAPPPPGPPAGTPTGTGNWLTAGLGSGFYGTLGALGQGGEAVARAVGASGVGDKLADFAKSERDTAATYARPDLENGSWADPATFGYRMAQALPSMAGVIGAGALATVGAPEEAAAGVLGAGARAMIGTGAASFPLAVGENIQRARTEGQPVDQGTAVKALALGVPEAALQSIFPAMGEGMLAGRIGSDAFKPFGSKIAGKAITGAALGGLIQAPVGAMGEALMQAMGDPNRSFADRSQAIVDAALGGGITGVFYGGALHALSKKPPAEVSNPQLEGALNNVLRLPPGDPNADQTVSSGGVPNQARLAPPALQLPSPNAPGMEKGLPDYSPAYPPTQAAGDVVTPPAQPGQAIRQLPAPTFEPGVRRAQSGEVITGGQIHQGEPVDTTPPALPPPTLEGQRVGADEVIHAPDQSPPPLGLPAPTPDAPENIRRAGSGEVIQGRQLFQDEPLPPQVQKLLGVDPTAEMPGKERVLRPASEDDTIPLPDQSAPIKPVVPPEKAAQIVTQAKRGVAFGRLGDLTDVQSALFDHVNETLEAQKAPYEPSDIPDILGARVTKAARAAGVLDDKNNVTDPWKGQESTDTTKAEGEAADAEQTTDVPEAPAEAAPVPARTQKDPQWSDARKTAFDKLEALRSSIPANLPDLHTQVSNLQSQLTKPGKGGVGGIITATRDIAKAIDGQAAVDKARGVETPPTKAPVAPDNLAGAEKFTADPAQANPQANPVEVKATKKAPNPKVVPLSSDTFSSREPTPHDQALSDLVDKGATMRQVLEHIAKNGSNTVRRTMAQRMLARSTADGSVRFGTLDEAQTDHPTLRQVYGDYNGDTGETRIFDRADMEHTLLHEFAHAATLKGLRDPALKTKVTAAMDAARKQMTPEEAAHPSMKNEEEFLAHAMSNPDFASMLDGMDGPGGRTVWGSIKAAIGRFFGWPQSAEGMLDHVEHLGGEATRMTNDANSVPGIERNLGLHARTMQDRGDEILREFKERVDPKGIGANTFKRLLFWRTLNDITTGSARDLPSGPRKVQDNTDMRNYQESFAGVLAPGDNARRALNEKERSQLDRLEGYSANDIDPARGIKAHVWLNDKQQKARAPQVQQANELLNQAKRGDAKVYKAYMLRKANNETQQYATRYAMGKLAVENSGAKIKVDDAMARFNNDTRGIKDDPVQARQFWKSATENLEKTVGAYSARVKGEADSLTDSPGKVAEARAHAAGLDDWLAHSSRMQAAMDQAPNFALRRDGDQYVAGELHEPTQAKIERLADMFKEAGHGDIMLDHNSENNNIYMRTKGLTRAQELKDVLNKAVKEGIIKPDSVKANAASQLQQFTALPRAIRATLGHLESMFPDKSLDPDQTTAFNSARESAMGQLRSQLLDLTPASSYSKIFAERQGVQGASTNMGRSYLDRGTNTARMIAQMFKARDITSTNKGLRDEVEAATNNANISVSDANKVKSAAQEMFMRDMQRQWKLEKSPLDGLRRVTHLFELGLSVPYTLALASQTWSLGHGELTKHFGAGASAAALARTAPEALDVLRRNFKSDNSLLHDIANPGSDRWGFNMTAKRMEGHNNADFWLDQRNRGTFNNSQTQWVYDGLQHHEGAMRQLHDISGAWTLYSEMNPRANVAAAARDLYRARAAEGKAPRGPEWTDEGSFVKHIVDSSQFDWSGENNPRAFGKQGVAGIASPLIAQFQSFRGKMLEKMHREFADAMGARNTKNADGTINKTYQNQARRFLVMHLAAQTALAGTMGLPAVSMLAGVYDKLADLVTGDHTHDLRASYRGWLSTVFGNTAGEALAHGVSRLGGVDLSEHLGEDRLLPLTDLMTDKRKLEDAYGDWLKEAAGTMSRLGYKMALGARDMTNGDYLKGAAKFMPEMLQNVVEAQQMGQYGYEDKAGFKYPGAPPTGRDIAAKALGFTPSDEANYDEKEKIVEGQEVRQDYDKSNIMTHLAKAFNRQDPQAYQDWIGHSMNFMTTHPGMMPPAGEFGQYLQEHMRAAALAGATGAPLNTNLRDYISQRLVNYGNAGDK